MLKRLKRLFLLMQAQIDQNSTNTKKHNKIIDLKKLMLMLYKFFLYF